MIGTHSDELARLLEKPLRTVKPRSRTYKRLPVVAIAGDTVLAETGEVGTTEALISNLREMEPTLFIKLAAADFISHLNGIFLLRDPDHWQWRIATHERDVIRPDGFRMATRVSTVIPYFGFKGGNYHKIIDPVSTYGHKLDSIIPGDDPQIVKLLKWGVSLRDFCFDNGIEVRPTMGGISSQLLTDRRFYPNARRKVPAATNEQVREHQPGNFYHLTVHPTPRKEYTAYYLDQTQAHHYHALTTTLPDSNLLYAFGRFHDLDRCVFRKPWANFYGLYCLDLEAPKQTPFNWIQAGERKFVFSNELTHLMDMGYKVKGIRAAWGSRSRDEGLSRYAHWAMSRLDELDNPAWLKPILLSAYGALATRPRYGESIFRLATSGDPVTVFTGHRQLNGRQTKGKVKLEPRIANVLHRGMIEAATRSESVGLAQWLSAEGQTVLSIYADAVIVKIDDDKPLSDLLLEGKLKPWRVKRTLNHLQFINQQAFISGEMTKLPGVSRELLQYSQHHKPGHAPRKTMYDALTGQKIPTDRRI